MRRLHLQFVAAAICATACSGSQGGGPTDPGSSLAIEVAPLRLDGVAGAAYDLTVTTGSGNATQTVWSKAGLLTSEYGDGKGSLSYVGPCDASAGVNRVTLTLVDLYSAGGQVIPRSTWQNPTPVYQDIPCRENADTAVVFDLTIMRSAVQGFFDVAVNFSDIFCSAKLDCQPQLLHNPATTLRDLTAVMAFACTAGQGQETTLYLNDLRIECAGDPTHPAKTLWVDPSGGPGNMGPVPAVGANPPLFQTATYYDRESLGGLDKCYWNTALGLDLAALGPNCVLHAHGTAADQPFGAPPRHTPPGAVYPVIDWVVPLTDADGDQACGSHPLNGGEVTTRYTDMSGERFTYEMDCNDTPDPEAPGRVVCTRELPTMGPVAFTEIGDGVVVMAAGQRSPLYALPAGLSLATCCPSGCCGR